MTTKRKMMIFSSKATTIYCLELMERFQFLWKQVLTWAIIADEYWLIGQLTDYLTFSPSDQLAKLSSDSQTLHGQSIYHQPTNWMAWCKRGVSDFFRWNFFPFKSAWIFACAFQLSSTTFPCIFFGLVCTLFLRKTKIKYSSVHNDHNKTEQEHFSQKNDAGECFST